jgi:glycosyltransferase involved in cell wall biosynthesis
MSAGFKLPDYVKEVVKEATEVNLRVTSKMKENIDPSTPILITVIRNELDRLPDFFLHYRKLGIGKFVVIDNGSTDGSEEYVRRQPDVDFFPVHRPFVWPRKQGWISRAIHEYGPGRWYIYVDADEHLVFDQMFDGGIAQLVRFAENRGINRVRGMLIDMYARGPLLNYNVSVGQSLLSAFPLYDTDTYNEYRYEQIISRKGGPRPRCFRTEGVKFNPELTKYPLFRLTNADIMANPHHIFPYAGNFDTGCYIGILHFKFLPGLIERIKVAIASENYWDGSAEYKQYLRAIQNNPNLTLVYPGSARLNSVQDLVSNKIIEPLAANPLYESKPFRSALHKARAEYLSGA